MERDVMQPQARQAPVDTSKIPGWGVDADPDNDPTWPMRDRSQDDAPGRHWVRPVDQPQEVEVLKSIEHNERPAVFGSPNPPSGLSGQVRRAAFEFSESRWSHWLLLMLADRINVVEGVCSDLSRGHVPNLIDEFGVKAAWKYDRPAFVRRVGTAAAVGGLAVMAGYMFAKRRARRRHLRRWTA
jgi:hypothetical protein